MQKTTVKKTRNKPRELTSGRSSHPRIATRSARRMRRTNPVNTAHPSASRIVDHACIEQNGRPTHILVPIKEYERLVQAEMVEAAVMKPPSDSAQWVDADSLALQLAGERIAAARRAAGLTQKQLGAKLNVPQSQISRIEHHPDQLTVRTLKRVAEALAVNLAALLP
jgi:HTH-type transcriptional regulator/antitoxin HipB